MVGGRAPRAGARCCASSSGSEWSHRFSRWMTVRWVCGPQAREVPDTCLVQEVHSKVDHQQATRYVESSREGTRRTCRLRGERISSPPTCGRQVGRLLSGAL